jgi:YidC/Oxa1 family membrane protein insertase
MLTLFRRLCLLLLAGFAAAQAEPEPAFTRMFGAIGEVGSFRARFARDGGGMVFLQAADHYKSLADARKPTKQAGDLLILASNGADHALRLFHVQPTTAFPADPSVARWTIEDVPERVTFTLDGGAGLVLEKVLRHEPKQRGFVLELALRNVSSTATGSLDFVLTGPMLVAPSESSLFGTLAVALAVPTGGEPQSVPPHPGSVHTFAVDGQALQFAGSTNRFFGAFLWPKDAAAGAALNGLHVDTLPLQDDEFGTKAGTSTRVRYGVRLQVPPVGQETRLSYGLYFGPKSYRVFDTLPEPARFAPILDVDLRSPCCGLEVPGGRMMAKLLLSLLGWFHDVVHNWGLAIVMLTILVRGLMLPLNFRMQKSMRAYGARMAVLKPKMDALKQKHADDQRAYQQAMVAFQREHKLMPPLGGCLPIFLTMPIYLGLFTALRTAYDVRQQPFVGWISDLSLPDQLATLAFWPHEFNLLPLVWIGMFVWLQTRMPLPTDPQQRQMQQMMRYMPILFGVMLYYYAAALLVYMVTSMAWSFVENALVKKVLGPMDPNVAGMAPQPI